MTLDARIEVHRDRFTLRLDLDVASGETVALLGPNGAGKSTALRVLAGLLRPAGGQVELAGTVLDAAGSTHVPADRRPVGMVFQDYRLFPHLSALENVAFGLRARGMPRPKARRVAGVWLERVGLSGAGSKRPAALSGGQAQRVALARALAPEPRLLLLDEPLAALDAATRIDLRRELRRHLSDFSGAAVLVTHDPLDAMVLARNVVVIENGTVVQRGPVAEVARHPHTDYVARLVGLNLFRGIASGTKVRLPDGSELTTIEPADGDVFVAFPPGAVGVFRTCPDGSPRNVFTATVADVEMHGGSVRVRLDGPRQVLADVTAAAVADLDLVPGREVWWAVKATETQVYPA
ncbi:MAG TPA: ABC transporter ATP-binding protein [Sporichthyaceae bacterium]|jgi:molybdate transport system ATP-binding protein|nr:ABC transporter ATP-binding protein [Sporichthyaceae bacterium]